MLLYYYSVSMVKRSIKRRASNKNKTVRKLADNFEQEIVIEFMQMLNMIKLYHWKTYVMPHIKRPMNCIPN